MQKKLLKNKFIKIVILPIFIFCVGLKLSAQIIYYPALYLPQSAQSSNHSDHRFSETVFNSATLTQIENGGIAISGYNQYAMNNNVNLSAVGILNYEKAPMAINFNTEQSTNLNNYHYRFIIAKKITDYWGLGINFNLFQMHFKPLATTKTSYYFEVNNLFLITRNLNATLKIANPIGGYLDKITQEKIARVIVLGLVYKYEKIAFNMEIIKEEQRDIYLHGSAWGNFKNLQIGLGFISQNQKPYTYVKYHLSKHFNALINADYHQYLGLSSGFGLEYLY